MDFYVVRIFDAPVRGPGFGPDFSLSGLVVGPVREALGPLTENAIISNGPLIMVIFKTLCRNASTLNTS